MDVGGEITINKIKSSIKINYVRRRPTGYFLSTVCLRVWIFAHLAFPYIRGVPQGAFCKMCFP